jgi:DNA-binding CsgD family transcriptional regulator
VAGVVLRGRAEEVAAVRAATRSVARTRRAGLVVIVGPPGVGKSALLHAATEQARRSGFGVGMGKAEEIDQIAPGEPLLVALRSGAHPLLGSSDFNDLASLYDRQLWLVERIGDLLADLARRGPILIGIDDVQWADRLTRFALRTLPSRLSDFPILWVIASRLSSPRVADEIIAAAEDSIDIRQVSLGNLSEAAIRDIARDHLGAPPTLDQAEVLRGVGGSPFWAVQVLKGLVRRRAHGLSDETMHSELLSGVHDRIAVLAPETALLVRTAAVCGRVLAVEDAGRILGRLPAQVLAAANDAEDNGLLRVTPEGVSLPHDLLRQAVYADIEPSERTRLHRVCARYLVSRGESFIEAAPHFLASATVADQEAAQALLRAAFDNEALVPETAAELAREAFDLLPPDHPAWSTNGNAALDLLLRVQREGDAVLVADRLMAGTAEPEAQALLQVQACLALWPVGANQDIERRADLAIGLRGISSVARARLRAIRSLASTRTDSAPHAAESAKTALADGKRLDDELTQRLALHALMEDARNSARHQDVFDLGVELRQLSGGTAYLAEHIRSLQHLDRYSEAEQLLATAIADVDHELGRLLPSLLWVKMWQEHNLSRLAAADADAERLLVEATQIGNFAFAMNARIVLSAVAIYRDDLPRARRHLDAAARSDEARDGLRVARLHAAQAWLSAVEGDHTVSLTMLRPLLQHALDGHHSWPWSPPWMRTFARIAMSAGDRATAEQALELAELGARRNPTVATMQGVAAQVRGIVHRDLDANANAVSVLRDAPRPLLLATALLDQGRALLPTGRDADASIVLDEAAHLFADLGVVRGERAVRLLQARSGLRRSARQRIQRRPDAGLLSLTAAELRVAEMIAAGYSSRATAAELAVSVNTVNTHVKSIYAKLGVRSRVQLANVLGERGGPAA